MKNQVLIFNINVWLRDLSSKTRGPENPILRYLKESIWQDSLEVPPGDRVPTGVAELLRLLVAADVTRHPTMHKTTPPLCNMI